MTHAAQIANLANMIGVSASDADSFIASVNMWCSKGLGIEAAIKKHMEVMTAMVNNYEKISTVLAKDAIFVGRLHGALVAA